MIKPWLILDSNFLCWRAFHAMGGLSFEGKMTGVLFGVFRDILHLQREFDTNRIAFCFDSRESDRKVKYPKYKSTRANRYKEMSDDEANAHREFRRQIRDLQRQHLHDIGFRNVFLQKGKEADDLVAVICKAYPKTKKIIVSSDEDLFQLLDANTTMWNPNQQRRLTLRWFEKTYNISPNRWADVKAIAGCSTDDVEGVKGVGEKTAIKFLNGTTNPKSKAHHSIIVNLKQTRRNLKLVSLPLAGTDPIRLLKDKVTDDKWTAKAEEFGMKSLHDVLMGTNKQWRKQHGKETKKRSGEGFGL